jgi:integrase
MNNQLKAGKTRNPNGQPRPYQSGNRWYAPAHISLANGEVVTIRATGKTKSAAVSKLRKLKDQRMKEYRIQNELEDSLKYLVPACANWLNEQSETLREYKTMEGYKHALDKWISPNFSSLRIDAIKYREIEKLRDQIMLTHSRSSWVQVRTLLNHVFNNAVRDGLIESNPVNFVKDPKKHTQEADFLTLEEAQKVMQQADLLGESARWFVALSVGCRQGEALGLLWENIDLDGSEPKIHIRLQLQRQTGRGLVLKTPKSKKAIRTITLDDDAVKMMRAHRRMQSEQRLSAGSLWNDQGFVFTGALGNPIDPKKDRLKWHSLLKASGVRKMKLHAARHTAATLMLYLRIPVHTVSNVLGHSSISITGDIYGHTQNEIVGKAVSDLNRAIRKLA